MQKLLIYANCQCVGLNQFLRMNPAFCTEFESSTLNSYWVRDLAIPVQAAVEAWRTADVVLYHWLSATGRHPVRIDDLKGEAKPGTRFMALSNCHNHGPFIQVNRWSEQLRARVREQVTSRGLEGATEHYLLEGDLDWVARRAHCFTRMKQKEQDEQVPEEAQMSRWLAWNWKWKRLLWSADHPTAGLFLEWAMRLSGILGVPWEDPHAVAQSCQGAPRTGMPTYVQRVVESEFICPSARAHLGLSFLPDGFDPSMKEGKAALKAVLSTFAVDR